MQVFSKASLGVSVSLLCISTLLTGCTLQTTSAPGAVAGTAISGTVHGGQQPILNAKVYLLAVNPTGYGGPGIAVSAANASVSLLIPDNTHNAADTIGSYVLTNNTTGGFSVAGDFSCTSGFAQSTGATVALTGSEQVYFYVLGGTGGATQLTNAASGLLIALGPCNNPTTQVSINEITTAATAYAFAGFATDATHIGSSGRALALTNLTNAFANVGNLVNAATGIPTASTATMTTPADHLYTIADIIAACVNTNGSLAASTNCNVLFAHTKSAGDTGTAPADTATATINLAHNPWPSAAGVTALFGLVPSTGAPYTGGLPSQPNEFSLFLKFSGNGLYQNQGIAIDGTGNVWVNSQSNPAAVSKFSNAGAALATAALGSNIPPRGIAIDTAGSAWVALQTTFANIAKFSSSDVAVTGPGPFSGGGINSSYGTAIDGAGNAWFANQGDGTISEFNSTGTPNGNTGFTSPDANQPTGIAIDAAGAVWATNYRGGSVTKFNANGTYASGSNGFSGGGMTSGVGGISIAIDSAGNAWTANFQASTVSEFSSTGTPLSSANGYSGGGLNGPGGIAIDGAGTVWLCNSGYSSLTALASNGTPLSSTYGYVGGYGGGGSTAPAMNQPYFLAIDGAGNVWVSNYGNSTISEMIGGGAPVVTPLPANFVSPYGSSAVNLP